MRHAFFRGIAIGCLSTLLIIAGVTHAASGGLLGDILAKILGITPAQVLTYTGDGTVSNSAKLGGLLPTQFQRVLPSQTCPVGQCIRGFDAGGAVMCQ